MTDLLERTASETRRTRSRAASRRLPDWVPIAAVAATIVTAAPMVLWACHVVHPGPLVHDVALFVHLGALILGFGGVLSVDWVGALYLLGRRSFLQVVQAADNAAVPIWAGYASLVFSGLLLEPNLDSTFTLVKLAMVLIIGLNGVVALAAHRALTRGADLRWMAIGLSVAVISQLSWWGATVIGYINAH